MKRMFICLSGLVFSCQAQTAAYEKRVAPPPVVVVVSPDNQPQPPDLIPLIDVAVSNATQSVSAQPELDTSRLIKLSYPPNFRVYIEWNK